MELDKIINGGELFLSVLLNPVSTKKKKIVSGWTIHLCITACDFTAFFSTLEELSKMLSGTAELPT